MITFSQIAIVFIFAFLVALIFRILKQPLIISYIFTGLILSTLLFKSSETKNIIALFSDLGIAFLLFVVGLELKLKTLREISLPAIIIGSLQEILTILFGFLIAKLIGFAILPALYLGIALSFSSTIIMVKLITDKGDLEKLYGKLAIGFLIVQDLITILILFFLPIISKSDLFFDPLKIIFSILILVFIPFLSIKIFHKIESFLTKSEEFIFLFSIAFGLGIGSLFKYLGFGLEAGALIAGISLSNLVSSTEIASKLKPLRDFFLILFFIFIGSEIFVSDFNDLLLPAIILSVFVLVGNPLIMLLILSPLGYKSKTAFLLGLTSAQISEFSFILINLGIKLGHVNQEILSLTALIGLITIFISSYFFVYGEKIYSILKPLLKIFEKKKTKEEKEEKNFNEIILFGCDRIGFYFLDVFKNLTARFLIVDYNFYRIKQLEREGYNVLYGDASEIDFLNELSLENARLIISTIPDYETNLLILREYKKRNPQGIFLATAYRINDALDLYKNNGDYIIMPHFLGGEHAKEIVQNFIFDKEKYLKLKEEHFKDLLRKIKKGFEHPKAKI